jgi:hypothetical protein
LFSSGCAKPSIVTKPEIVEVVRWRTQPVPDELVQDRHCPDAEVLKSTEDLVNAYQACWTSNAAHNADKAGIRSTRGSIAD